MGPKPVVFGRGVSESTPTPRLDVHELRFIVVSDDYQTLARLLRDEMGLPVFRDLDHQGGRGVILRVPEATLEVVDREHAAMVDRLEAGVGVDDRLRLALRVEDLDRAMAAAGDAGARAVADPVETPWGDRNRRYVAGDGIQLTLFQTS